MEKIISERQLDRRNDKDCMAEEIDEFLDGCSRYEVFSLPEEEKKKIIEQVQKNSDDWVRDDVLEEYDEIYLDV